MFLLGKGFTDFGKQEALELGSVGVRVGRDYGFVGITGIVGFRARIIWVFGLSGCFWNQRFRVWKGFGFLRLLSLGQFQALGRILVKAKIQLRRGSVSFRCCLDQAPLH